MTLTEHGAQVGAELAAGRRQFAEVLFADLSDRRFAAIVAGLDALLERLPEVLATEVSR